MSGSEELKLSEVELAKLSDEELLAILDDADSATLLGELYSAVQAHLTLSERRSRDFSSEVKRFAKFAESLQSAQTKFANSVESATENAVKAAFEKSVQSEVSALKKVVSNYKAEIQKAELAGVAALKKPWLLVAFFLAGAATAGALLWFLHKPIVMLDTQRLAAQISAQCRR